MHVTFLGVGEACDADHPNTSILVESTGDGGRSQTLLDCGFTAAHQYFRHTADPEALDFLWISHFHGDHFLGTPLLLLRFQEMARSRPLTILGPAGLAGKIRQASELAYPGFLTAPTFPLEFREVLPGAVVRTGGLEWLSAETDHSQAALAIRLKAAGKAIFYSGDGRPTEASLELARGCDLVIHEAFRFSGDTPGHGSLTSAIGFAAAAGAPALALLHLQRDERRKHHGEIQQLLRASTIHNVFMPEAGDAVTL